MPKQYDDDKKLVGSIWIKESQKGTRYLSVAVEDPEDEDRKFNMVAFKNKDKKSDKSPDYFIFYSEDDRPSKKSSKRQYDDDDEDDDEL